MLSQTQVESQRVAVCCSMLQYVAVCCKEGSAKALERGLVLSQTQVESQRVAVCFSMLQYVAVCCSMLQYVAVCCKESSAKALERGLVLVQTQVLVLVQTQVEFQRVAACCSSLQCVVKRQYESIVASFCDGADTDRILCCSVLQYVAVCCKQGNIGWLWLVGSIKLQGSFSEEPYKRDDILKKRHII